MLLFINRLPLNGTVIRSVIKLISLIFIGSDFFVSPSILMAARFIWAKNHWFARESKVWILYRNSKLNRIKVCHLANARLRIHYVDQFANYYNKEVIGIANSIVCGFFSLLALFWMRNCNRRRCFSFQTSQVLRDFLQKMHCARPSFNNINHNWNANSTCVSFFCSSRVISISRSACNRFEFNQNKQVHLSQWQTHHHL